MPTEKECNEIKIGAAVLSQRVDTMAERMEEILHEVKDIKDWFKKYGTICFLVVILGDKALPVIAKILGV